MTKKEKDVSPACAHCGLKPSGKICMSETGAGAKGCPTLTDQAVLAEANKEYEAQETREFARQASIQEAACYANRHQRPYVMQPEKTRIMEIHEFAARMGYHRLGLAFCVGLAKEAGAVARILESQGFEVVSMACKAGRTSKERIGIEDQDKIFQGTDESMCNPVYQAKMLNRVGTEFNILLGLCVGHDSLFFKYAEAPTTVLAVKDRVTGHNPLAAVYLSGTYYAKLEGPRPGTRDGPPAVHGGGEKQ